jgi:hypothetical protein
MFSSYVFMVHVCRRDICTGRLHVKFEKGNKEQTLSQHGDDVAPGEAKPSAPVW